MQNDRSTELDVRAIPARDKHPAIIGRFQTLTPGDAFTLVNDHDPVPVYHQLSALYPGHLAWDYVESGPDVWRVRIGRPQGAAPLPEVVRRSGAQRARTLDVRPILNKGGDPFALIMRTVGELARDEALHLVMGFEPTPLYTVMRRMGRAVHAERSDGVYQIWFYREV
jgi:uncharacterized protein (DUF2249 family)